MDLVGGRFSGLPRIQRHLGDGFISLHCLGAHSNPALRNTSWAETNEAHSSVLPAAYAQCWLRKGKKADLVDRSIKHTFSFTQVFKRMNIACIFVTASTHQMPDILQFGLGKWGEPLFRKWLLTRLAWPCPLHCVSPRGTWRVEYCIACCLFIQENEGLESCLCG